MATDYYKTLGVEPDADPTIIKRRYRLLVREHHPDAVAPGQRAQAHERMLAINAAWTVLSDPAERARYDRSLRPVVPPSAGQTAANRAANGAAPSTNGAARTSRPAGQSRTAARGTPPHGTPPRGSAARTASRNAARGSSRSANPRTRMLTLVFEAAELYFFHGRAQEAIEICNRVMKFDPKNAEAPALLGDIYAEQGRKDIAVLMYERAVRNQPDNALYRQKWDALRQSVAGTRQGVSSAAAASAAAAAGAARGPTPGAASVSGARAATTTGPTSTGRVNVSTAASRPATGSAASARAVGGQAVGGQTPAARTAARTAVTPDRGVPLSSDYVVAPNGSRNHNHAIGGLALLGSAAALIVWCNTEMLQPVRLSGTFSGQLTPAQPVSAQLVLTSAAAAALGASLPLLGMVKRFGQVRRGAPAFTGWPLLLCMAIAGALWFPLAFVVYLVASLLWPLWHKSLLAMLLSAVFLLVALRTSTPLVIDRMSQLVDPSFASWDGAAIFLALFCGWAFSSLLLGRQQRQ